MHKNSILLSGSLILLFSLVSLAGSGDIDPSFGQDGRVTTKFNAGAGAQAVSVQSDGKLIVAGWASGVTSLDFGLARYDSDGKLDSSFGTLGEVTTDFGSRDLARAIVLQPDGKIVVAGFTGDYPADFAVSRYNPDGSLDDTILGVLPLDVSLMGTVGFELKNSAASFGYVSVN